MKTFLMLLWIIALALPSSAQEETPEATAAVTIESTAEVTAVSTPPPPVPTIDPDAPPTPTPTPREVVEVESAFVRAAPDFEAEAVASVFENDILEVVGRNADGLWFEVRRPGRMVNLGWIFNEMFDLESELRPELLPLTDRETGLEGAVVIADTGFAAYFTAEATLRDSPSLRGSRVTLVPLGSTVPVIARNQNASWLQVNYLGLVGWVSRSTVRAPQNALEVLDEAPGLPPLQGVVSAGLVPPEIQLAQVERLREYVTASRDNAAAMAQFWGDVSAGLVAPCAPPPPLNPYPATAEDVRQLPELDRYVPRLNIAVDNLNDAIATLTECGVIDGRRVESAEASAINARIIFDNNLVQLDDLEAVIRFQRGQDLAPADLP